MPAADPSEDSDLEAFSRNPTDGSFAALELACGNKFELWTAWLVKAFPCVSLLACTITF